MASTPPLNHFDREKAACYDDRWVRLAPLRDSLHLQTALIFEELPADARVLCMGVGTGSELVALAQRFPGWRFVAADPSEPMLNVCRDRAAAAGIADRCEFHPTYVHDLPDSVRDLDGATALLVSHFIVDRPARVAFFRDINRRLRPGGVLVSAELTAASSDDRQAELTSIWKRMLAFTGSTPEQVEANLASYDREVALLPEAGMETLLREAGFPQPVHFSQSLLIHAWFSRRP